MKVDHKGKMQQIEETLMEALRDPAEDAEEPALSGAAAEGGGRRKRKGHHRAEVEGRFFTHRARR